MDNTVSRIKLFQVNSKLFGVFDFFFFTFANIIPALHEDDSIIIRDIILKFIRITAELSEEVRIFLI